MKKEKNFEIMCGKNAYVVYYADNVIHPDFLSKIQSIRSMHNL